MTNDPPTRRANPNAHSATTSEPLAFNYFGASKRRQFARKLNSLEPLSNLLFHIIRQKSRSSSVLFQILFVLVLVGKTRV